MARRRPGGNGHAWLGWLVIVALLAAACQALPQARSSQVDRGDPTLGKLLLVEYGCVGCHHIPGVPGADAYVGPPLDRFGQRSYIAGSLTNNQENLIRWIVDPQGVEPGTAMPDLDVSEDDAINISAYLLSQD